ncbi:hypothetical protein B723_15135 [Pseudomonas fluorescens NCIMB 11764]|jgi:hypothetical protein|uniref:Uncharacterized protein n=1 Tax=Pseudomonas fluorescens NCIMB 11764 TaxID=1221522 RepID=A0A0K1QPK8_PSEFL|nr:hypothetical protein [Pseudomonas fluorescens]AKV07681.1 hypothetical protein B723_15135 [Pseudomonas fluorescens NCIMB 11764]
MKIETVMNTHRLEQMSAVVPLDSRLLQASGIAPDVNGSKRPGPDPEFDELYQRLLAMEGQGEKAIYEFLRSLRGTDGVTPAYPSAKALMAVTLQLLVRLKDDGLEKTQLYKEIKGANGMAFSMNVFVMSYTRDVFQPMGDDAWEKSEW